LRVLDETLKELATLAKTHRRCIVGVSGGKDSLACLSLAKQCFAEVVGFHMEFVPDLECIEDDLRVCRDLWGIEIRKYVHWGFAQAISQGTYTWDADALKITPWTLADVFRLVQRDTGIWPILWGAKLADSAYRRRTLNRAQYDGVFFPLKKWSKFEVLALLKSRDIPIPDQIAAAGGGIDLSTPSLLYLHDNHPRDFERLERFFPFARSVVKRREFFGER